jgi:hypothetical protein
MSRALIASLAIVAFTVAPATNARTGSADAGASTAGGAQPAACRPGKRACPIRINFAAGAYSGQASSRLRSITAKRWFVVRLHRNQQVTEWVIGDGPTRGTILFPNGGGTGGPGGRIWDDTVPSTGDYLIKATESLMAEEWSGKVTVLVVAI